MNWIKDGDEVLALFIPSGHLPDKTQFLTPDNFKQQLGYIVYKAGEEIIPHDHKKMERTIVGSSEVVILQKGKMEVYIFKKNRDPLLNFEMNVGDILLLIDGGHGFKMLEDSTLLEIKQGPYIGLEEKERFAWRWK